MSSKEGHNSKVLIPQTAAIKNTFPGTFPLVLYSQLFFSVILATSSTYVACAGLLFYCLTGVNVKAPSVTSISDEERAARKNFMCQPENQRLRTLWGYCLVRGKGHKSFQVWNEMILEDTRGFKCQLEENTSRCFFHTSFASTHLWSLIFFSIPKLKDGIRCC